VFGGRRPPNTHQNTSQHAVGATLKSPCDLSHSYFTAGI
jgi:hypothetical protein